jgi:hypothetical protein
MQSLQLHLTGAARSWLSKLEKETIGSWEELTKQFTSNFKSTYIQAASIHRRSQSLRTVTQGDTKNIYPKVEFNQKFGSQSLR